MPTPLTPHESKILEFLKSYMNKKGYAPTYQEIKDHFEFASFFSVQRYLKQLEGKGYIRTPWQNKKRAIEVLNPLEELREDLDVNGIKIPFLGLVAAGLPIEAIENKEWIEVPSTMARTPHKNFALKVTGDSMIDDGIHDGDILIIQKQSTAHNGQTVVALVDQQEATVKRFYDRGVKIELRPANPTMKPFFIDSPRVKIQGVVVGLMRNFR